MELQYLGKLIIAFFIGFKFFLIPLCSGIFSIIKLLTTKNILKRAGINYLKMADVKNNEFEYIILGTLFVLFIFFMIAGKWFFPMLCLGFFLWYLGDILGNKLFGNISGIYQNGIIDCDKNFVEWKQIHSYKINENNISGYFQNGNLFEYNDIDNIIEIKKLFEDNNIMKRE
jgi:hypothetical protein